MKKLLLTILAALAMTVAGNAASLSSLTWAEVCQGKMGDEWYGSAEAQQVADNLISVQKTNGGWMKNDQFHKLSASELAARQASTGTDGRGAHSCFDNYATTQEMRFLVRVYRATNQTKYLTAFNKALSLIYTAANGKRGGWGQYWPNSGNDSYQDYITFNDDLMTNMMKMLQDVYENKGMFEGLVNEAGRKKAKQVFDAALNCVLACQIDDNGVKAAWCAQHDPADFLPAEGRPHEEPSVSAYESATLLQYLMTFENPSEELKESIVAAVKWLRSHKYKTDSYIEDVKDANGNVIDRKISKRKDSNVWGRFIQIGGKSGEAIYNKFYNKLKTRGKTRAHHVTGFVYQEYQILEESYDPTKEYQPIFSVYSDAYPELFYRHLYNYEDTPDMTDKHGQTIITSLPAANRKSYQYLGTWPDKVIAAFPAWCAKNGITDDGGDDDPQGGNGDSNLWKVTADELTEGAAIISNELADIKVATNTVTPTHLESEETGLESPKTIAGESFNYVFNLRVTDAPSATNPTGTVYEDNEGNKNCIALVVEAKKNVDVALYYKVGASKAISCFDQTAGESIAIKQEADNPGDDYLFCKGVYQFIEGHTYTIYAKGGTVNVYGISTAEGTYEAPAAKIYASVAAAPVEGYSTMTYADGSKIILMKSGKNWSNGSGVMVGDMQYTGAKVSNGAQNKFIAPEGQYVTKVTIYSSLNVAAKNRPAYWSEVNGVKYTLDGAEDTKVTTEMMSFKDGNNPDVYTYDLGGVSEFTFTNTGEQCCFVMEVEYGNKADAVAGVKANDSKIAVRKYIKDGQVVIETADGIINASAAKMK